MVIFLLEKLISPRCFLILFLIDEEGRWYFFFSRFSFLYVEFNFWLRLWLRTLCLTYIRSILSFFITTLSSLVTRWYLVMQNNLFIFLHLHLAIGLITFLCPALDICLWLNSFIALRNFILRWINRLTHSLIIVLVRQTGVQSIGKTTFSIVYS